MRVAIYTRKSVYVENSESIDTQIKLCKTYLKGEHEYEVFQDDGFSGKNTKRPAFQRMMNLIQMGKFDALICYRLDRISRNVLDFSNTLELLNQYNVNFISLNENFDTSNPMGRAMVYISSVFAQLERETIAARVKDNMLQLAKKGCWTGGPQPAGYEVIKSEGKSYLQLKNIAFIEDCFNSYINNQSLYAVHQEMLKKYIETPKQRENLRRILRSPMYVKSDLQVSEYLKLNGWEIVGKENGKGYLCYGVTTGYPTAIVSKHEAVIEPQLWVDVQLLLDKKREGFFNKESKVYWLSGILKCPYCGGLYVIVNSAKHTYYACTNRIRRKNKNVELCKNDKYVNAEKIESEIENFIKTLADKETFSEKYNNINDNNKEIYDYTKLEKELSKLNSNINNLYDKLMILSNEAAKPIITKIEEFTNKKVDLENEIQEFKLLSMPKKHNDDEYIFETIMEFNNSKTPNQKRIHIRNIFESIVYNPDTDIAEYTFS